MIIVRRGTPPPAKVRSEQFTCENCNSLLEVFENDRKTHVTESEVIEFVICPVCGKFVTLARYFPD